MFKTNIEIENKRWPILGTQEVSLKISIQSESEEDKIPVKDLFLSLLEKLPNIYQVIESGRINTNIQFADLCNLRGRPAETFKEHSFKSNQEELLFITGTFFEEEDEEDYKTKKEESDIDFQLRLKSEFSTFRKDKICYCILPEFNEEITEVINENKIPEFLQKKSITIDAVRLGIEVFKPAFLGSMIGIFPKISTRYYLELSEAKCLLFYNYPSSSSCTDSSGDPLGIIKTLDSLLRSFKIEDNLLKHMVEKVYGK